MDTASKYKQTRKVSTESASDRNHSVASVEHSESNTELPGSHTKQSTYITTQSSFNSEVAKSPDLPPSMTENGAAIKEEVELTTMEHATSLNNLIRVAVAETLTSKPAFTQDQANSAGNKGYPINNTAESICVSAQAAPNLIFAQPQFTGASGHPQLFIAGPNPPQTGGMSYPQILIPINPSPHIQPNLGQQVSAQQFITIPASPIQFLANQPIIAAANFTGLQPFTMMPDQTSCTLSSASQNSKPPAVVAPGSVSIVPPMLLSAASPAVFSAAPLTSSTQQHQQDVTGKAQRNLNNPMVKFLPSIQSLVSSSVGSQPDTLTSRAAEDLLTNENCSPGANETLVSSTEPGSIIDGINLDDIKEFAKQFKSRRLSMGLTQTQVGQALSVAEGPAYSQSAICRFEKLDITPKSAQKIKPVLEKWLLEAEARYHSGTNSVGGIEASDRLKKRKRRTSFTPQAVEVLLEYYLKNSHPSGSEMTCIANKLGYDREVVRVWFCNKRQALKNASKKLKPDTSTADVHSSQSPALV